MLHFFDWAHDVVGWLQSTFIPYVQFVTKIHKIIIPWLPSLAAYGTHSLTKSGWVLRLWSHLKRKHHVKRFLFNVIACGIWLSEFFMLLPLDRKLIFSHQCGHLRDQSFPCYTQLYSYPLHHAPPHTRPPSSPATTSRPGFEDRTKVPKIANEHTWNYSTH